jgi:hypothetical protein
VAPGTQKTRHNEPMVLRVARGKKEIVRDANGLGFVALNAADVWLTRLALQSGASEANPIVDCLGGNMEAKVLASVAVVSLLWLFGKDRIVTLLNIGMGLVVLWNAAMVTLTALN